MTEEGEDRARKGSIGVILTDRADRPDFTYLFHLLYDYTRHPTFQRSVLKSGMSRIYEEAIMLRR